MLYLARAFSTLEGIGLGIDENYSIVQECYPYLARRLFTDRNPRAKAALRSMLGLEEEEILMHNDDSALYLVQKAAREAELSEKKKRGLSPAKLLEMSEGFAEYTAATADVDQVGKGQQAAVEKFSKLFLDPKGSTLQDIFVEETAKLGDTVTRAALRRALVDNPAARAAASVLNRNKETAELVKRIDTLVAQNEDDVRTLTTVQELRNVLGPRLLGDANGTSDIKLDRASVRELLSNVDTRKLASEQLPGAAALGRRVSAGLFRRAAFRAEVSKGLIPEATRQRLIKVNNALADALEPSHAADDEQHTDL